MTTTTKIYNADLLDRSVITFDEVFEIVKGGYYCAEAFDKQWDILNHINLCMFEECSYIKDLTQLESEVYRSIVSKRLANQVEMEQAIKYAGVVPHVANVIEVGAILYSSWGYDQTNVDYYVVVEVSKSMCKLLELNSRAVAGTEGSDWSVNVTASKNIDFGSELLRKKIQAKTWGDGCPYVRIASYASANLWDGRQKYTSSGH
jgi:hypothetical protein